MRFAIVDMDTDDFNMDDGSGGEVVILFEAPNETVASMQMLEYINEYELPIETHFLRFAETIH